MEHSVQTVQTLVDSAGVVVDSATWLVVKMAFGAMSLVSCYHYVRRTWFGEREDTEKLYSHMMRKSQVLSAEHVKVARTKIGGKL